MRLFFALGLVLELALASESRTLNFNPSIKKSIGFSAPIYKARGWAPQNRNSELEPMAKAVIDIRGGEMSLGAQTLADAFGTFLLLVVVRLSSRVPERWTRPYHFPVLVALAFLIYIFGPISGASFNPAVNMSMLVMGEMSIRKFFWYSASQLAAAGFAAKLIG